MSAETRRQAIVWDAIERMAFKPRDLTGWLSIFDKSLHRIWQVQPTDVGTRRLEGFDVTFLHLVCDYSVGGIEKYDATIRNVFPTVAVSWCVHVDPTYLSKSALHQMPDKYAAQDIKRHLQSDIERVLNGMLFHPRNHVHGEDLSIQPEVVPEALPMHEIRIGNGIENALVFLTHLRWQFCILSAAAREAERLRLITLFASAISDGRKHVPAGELFDL